MHLDVPAKSILMKHPQWWVIRPVHVKYGFWRILVRTAQAVEKSVKDVESSFGFALDDFSDEGLFKAGWRTAYGIRKSAQTQT